MIKIKDLIRKKIIMISIGIMLGVIVISNIAISISFKTYIDNNRSDDLNTMVEYIRVSLNKFPLTNENIKNALAIRAKAYNMEFIILDKDLNELYNSKNYIVEDNNDNQGNGSELVKVETFYITLDSNEELRLDITTTYEGALSKIDSNFFITINAIFIFIAIIGVIVSYYVAKATSRQISDPIEEAAKQIKLIYEKQYEEATAIETNIAEIRQLSEKSEDIARDLKIQHEYQKQITIDIAHELKSPLTIIKGYVETFIDGIWETNKNNLQNLLKQIVHLNNLIDDLNDFSLLEQDGYILNLSNINIVEVLQTSIDTYEPEFAKKNLYVKFKSTEEIKINLDEKRVKQIFGNLLSNALKYTEVGGLEVSVTKNLEKETVEVSFCDTGIGIREDSIDRIFQRFYMEDKARGISHGSGIGLSVVKSLIEKHKGTIEVKSELGKGSCFTLFFPYEKNKY